VAHGSQESAFCLAGSLGGVLCVLQLLLELLAFRNVFRGDNDSPDFPLRIIPRINGGTYPLLRTIGANPDVLDSMLLRNCHSATKGKRTLMVKIGDQYGRGECRKVEMSKAVVRSAALAAR
jgi:hypothetical protein